MAAYLGYYEKGFAPAESALGVFKVFGEGWYARVWRENFGPFPDRATAEGQLSEIANPWAGIVIYRNAQLIRGLVYGSIFGVFSVLLLAGAAWLFMGQPGLH